MEQGAFVVRRGCRQHDQAMTRRHLTVCEHAALVQPSLALLEAEGARQPRHRRGSVGVGEHGHHTLRVVVHTNPSACRFTRFRERVPLTALRGRPCAERRATRSGPYVVGRGHVLPATSCTHLVDQPGGCVRLLDGTALGQQLAGSQRVSAASHRCQAEVRHDRVEPQCRAAGSPGPVAGQLGACRVPQVVVAHRWQHLERRAPEDRVAMPDEFGPHDSGQDSLYERPVGPSRVNGIGVKQLSSVDVDASELQTRARTLIEGAMNRREDGLASAVDRTIDQGHEVEVAHMGDVVVGRHRATDEQIRDPTEVLQLCSQFPDNEGRCGHVETLTLTGLDPPSPVHCCRFSAGGAAALRSVAPVVTPGRRHCARDDPAAAPVVVGADGGQLDLPGGRSDLWAIASRLPSCHSDGATRTRLRDIRAVFGSGSVLGDAQARRAGRSREPSGRASLVPWSRSSSAHPGSAWSCHAKSSTSWRRPGDVVSRTARCQVTRSRGRSPSSSCTSTTDPLSFASPRSPGRQAR